MKPVLLLFCAFFWLPTASLKGQNEAAIWYFGRNAGLDFNSGAPVVLNDGQLNTLEGCATMADTNGNLLFYTDGSTVWNRNHVPMLNGTGLNGHPSSTQSGIIVPAPGNPTIFYVFTADLEAYPEGINYSEINLSLDGGLGDVTAKNIRLIAPATEKLTAVQHANGTDVWVITHGWDNDAFLAYLVTATGVTTTPIISNVGIDLGPIVIPNIVSKAQGYLKASPDGTKLAIAHNQVAIELLDFDAATGIVSNPLRLREDDLDYYGLAFSPSGNVLYVSQVWGDIFQYNLLVADISASEFNLNADFNDNGALQLAIDGRIYLAHELKPYLSVINNPDIVGPGCDFSFMAVDLGTRLSQLGLPTFIQSYFAVDLQASNFCLGDGTEFSVNTSEPVTSITWDFGDGNGSALETPTHTYATPGTYTVSVTVSTASETKTETKDITIYTTPVASATTDFEVCTTETMHEFDLTTKDSEVRGGLSAFELGITYHPSLIDAEAGTNALPDLYTPSAQLETIVARLSNTNNPSCYDTTSFDLIVKAAPVLGTITDWVACDTDTDGLFDFDLSQKDLEILNGQSATDFSVSYHLNQADADANTGPIGPNYTNTGSPQTIYARIQNSTYPECFETGSFALEVITNVIANAPTPLEVCDDDNDGFFTYDLTQSEAAILGTQNPANFSVSYHPTLADADANTNALNGSAYTNTMAYSETLYARVQNNGNPDCYNTTTLDLRVHDSPTQETVTPLQVCDDNNDGIQTVDLTTKDNEIFGSQTFFDFMVTYHASQADADTGANPIFGLFTNTVNPTTIYYRKANNGAPDCYVTGSFDVEVYDTPTAGIPTDWVVCDAMETGTQVFDLSEKDAEVLNGQDPATYEVLYFASLGDAIANQDPLPKTGYTNSAAQETIYATLQNRGFDLCFELTQFELIVNPLPNPDINPTYVICPDDPELTIDGGDFESWSWQDEVGTELGTTRSFLVSDLGNYNLTVTQTVNGTTCNKTIPFEVVSSGAPETIAANISGFSDNITVEIVAAGTGDFEYSVDGEDFQDSNVFEVFPGEYTVYVRDIFLCRTLSTQVIALGYQKFFTPNGDGSNEYWNIIGAANFADSQLYIFDRYGKMLKQIATSSQGWDGTFNGTPLPESDYWFRYVYEDGKEFKGHFSLKR